jgi:hypothetical protein
VLADVTTGQAPRAIVGQARPTRHPRDARARTCRSLARRLATLRGDASAAGAGGCMTGIRFASALQFGVLAGLRVQLLNGLVAPRRDRPRSQRATGSYRRTTTSVSRPTGFIGRGRRTPMWNY